MAKTTIRIHYPTTPRRRGGGFESQIVLYRSPDWATPHLAVSVTPDGHITEFVIAEPDALSFEFKVVLEASSGPRDWSVGHNYRVVCGTQKDLFPFFKEDSKGDLHELQAGGRQLTVYTPPGYRENPLRFYPVLYMQDGQNLFEPGVFGEWQVDETLDALNLWSHISKCIVVGIHHGDRLKEFSDPGWRDYRDLVVDHVIPKIQNEFRVDSGRDNTAIMGSSLGGLAALYLAWDRPDLFSKVACFSGAFPEFGKPFAEMILRNEKPDLFVYLDSGMAGVQSDGFDSTREIRDLMLLRGFEFGRDLIYYCFPEHKHNEAAWATRFSIPLQHFFGR
jgi:predicted alpha/beta superfamily hydrolase